MRGGRPNTWRRSRRGLAPTRSIALVFLAILSAACTTSNPRGELLPRARTTTSSAAEGAQMTDCPSTSGLSRTVSNTHADARQALVAFVRDLAAARFGQAWQSLDP